MKIPIIFSCIVLLLIVGVHFVVNGFDELIDDQIRLVDETIQSSAHTMLEQQLAVETISKPTEKNNIDVYQLNAGGYISHDPQ